MARPDWRIRRCIEFRAYFDPLTTLFIYIMRACQRDGPCIGLCPRSIVRLLNVERSSHLQSLSIKTPTPLEIVKSLPSDILFALQLLAYRIKSGNHASLSEHALPHHEATPSKHLVCSLPGKGGTSSISPQFSPCHLVEAKLIPPTCIATPDVAVPAGSHFQISQPPV